LGLTEVDVGDHPSPLPKNDLQKEHPKSEVHRRSRIMLGMRKTFWIVIVVSVFLGGCEGPHVWDYQILMPKEADLVGTYKIRRFHNDVDKIADFSRTTPSKSCSRPTTQHRLLGSRSSTCWRMWLCARLLNREPGSWIVVLSHKFIFTSGPCLLNPRTLHSDDAGQIFIYPSRGTLRPIDSTGASVVRMWIEASSSSE